MASDDDEPVTTATTTTTTTTSRAVVSAPGKILLAGGYLILEEGQAGVVVAVDKRFYCECRIATTTAATTTTTATTTTASPGPATFIAVESPQFGGRTWRYRWDRGTGQLLSAATTATKEGEGGEQDRNPFVEKALRVALLYLDDDGDSDNRIQPNSASANNSTTVRSRRAATTRRDILFRIAADSDFYGLLPHLRARGWPRTLEAARRLPPRLPAAARKRGGGSSSKEEFFKTGLGSSACLVTALTAALVRAWNDNSHNDAAAAGSGSPQQQPPATATATGTEQQPRGGEWRTTVSRLAQIGHCHAQGKVGSGFDVSAACFGTHVYRRFSAAWLRPLLRALEESSDGDGEGTSAAASNNDNDRAAAVQQLLRDVVRDRTGGWTGGVQSGLHCFSTAAGTTATTETTTSRRSFLQCLMADVAGGSESPGMARRVLQWRREQQLRSPSSCPHWDDLAALNPQIVSLLRELDAVTAAWTDEELARRQRELVDCGGADRWPALAPGNPAAGLLHRLRGTFQECRRHLKAMGECAGGVPIEPAPQTALCDACLQIPGVVAALVPGAGGYDAVVCVYVNAGPDVPRAVAELWANWNGGGGGGGDDDDGNTTTTTVCPLTVQGADFGQGVRVEAEFPSLAVEEKSLTHQQPT